MQFSRFLKNHYDNNVTCLHIAGALLAIYILLGFRLVSHELVEVRADTTSSWNLQLDRNFPKVACNCLCNDVTCIRFIFYSEYYFQEINKTLFFWILYNNTTNILFTVASCWNKKKVTVIGYFLKSKWKSSQLKSKCFRIQYQKYLPWKVLLSGIQCQIFKEKIE